MWAHTEKQEELSLLAASVTYVIQIYETNVIFIAHGNILLLLHAVYMDIILI